MSSKVSESACMPGRNLLPVLLKQWMPEEKLPEIMNPVREDRLNCALTPELNRHMLR